eukprot:jgi/Bigna1/76140/fgenesh1_pg.39_\
MAASGRPMPVTCPPCGVAIKDISAERGRGVVTTNAFKQGDVVISELPLLSSQDGANMPIVLSCQRCLRPLGSVELHMDILTGDSSATDLTPPSWSLPVRLADCCSDKKGGGEGASSSSSSSSSFSQNIAPCRHGCGALYCGKECADEAYWAHHRLLCVGPLKSTEAPLYQFKMHAIENNLDLLFAGQVVANMLCRYFQLLDMEEKSSADSLSAHLALITQAKRPYASFQHNKWWDVTVPPADMAHLPREEFERILKNQLARSYSLLMSAFREELRKIPGGWREEEARSSTEVYEGERKSPPSSSSLLESSSLPSSCFMSLDEYGSIVGMMHQNQLGIRRPSVVKEYLFKLRDYSRSISSSSSSDSKGDGKTKDEADGRNVSSKGMALRAEKAAASWRLIRDRMGEIQASQEDEDEDEDEGGEEEDGKDSEEKTAERKAEGEGDNDDVDDDDDDRKLEHEGGTRADVGPPMNDLDAVEGGGEQGNENEENEGEPGEGEEENEGEGGEGGDGEEEEEEGEEEGDEGEEMSIEDVLKNDDFVDSLLCPFDGAALFSLICTLNHSCSPNVVIDYGEGFGPARANVVALRDIEAGEELCFSYLRKQLPLAERRHELLDYGFTCSCPLCKKEEEEEKKGNATSRR